MTLMEDTENGDNGVDRLPDSRVWRVEGRSICLEEGGIGWAYDNP